LILPGRGSSALRGRSQPRNAQRGALLIGVLVFIALAALAAVQAGPRWADARQRAAEEELLFVGEQYRAAIESYWREAPNKVNKLPANVDDLIEDKRFPFPKRHLRKPYRDPLAPQQTLAEIREGGALIGVYSSADGMPFRQAGFVEAQKAFNGASSYAQWKFSFKAPAAPTPAPAQGNTGKSTTVRR
jgi:type II secretory pathway pseudopilin PulG